MTSEELRKLSDDAEAAFIEALLVVDEAQRLLRERKQEFMESRLAYLREKA